MLCTRFSISTSTNLVSGHTQIYMYYNTLYMVCTDIFCKHDTSYIYSQIAFHTIVIISHYFI
jgi:proline dehydrogenase